MGSEPATLGEFSKPTGTPKPIADLSVSLQNSPQNPKAELVPLLSLQRRKPNKHTLSQSPLCPWEAFESQQSSGLARQVPTKVLPVF